jgi:predicted DNA-binding protein (UPF0251 family)
MPEESKIEKPAVESKIEKPAVESKLVEKLKQKVEEEKTPEPEVIIFTEDELSALRQVQQDYLECQTAFGQIAVQKIALQQQIDILSKSETD